MGENLPPKLHLVAEESYRKLRTDVSSLNTQEIDVVLIHGPCEYSAGRFVAEKVDEIWSTSLIERRNQREKCEHLPILCAEWTSIAPRVICEVCKKDILPQELKIQVLDASYLAVDDFLEDLASTIRTKQMLVFVVLTNKLLQHADLLIRIYYLQKSLSTQDKFLYPVFIEELKVANYLFEQFRPLKFYCKNRFGTIIPQTDSINKSLFKRILSTTFTNKAWQNKFRHACYSENKGYNVEYEADGVSSDSGIDTVDIVNISDD